jgi:hypothetical protein
MKIATGLLTLAIATTIFPAVACAQTTYTGTVERVWEDGFRLDTGDRSFRVDSWELYGDRTPQFIAEGDQITVIGEFEGGEFDAFSIPTVDATAPRYSAQASRTSYSGTVERVWEDGFQINTGDRSMRVDSWDLYGDNTRRFISEGDQITVVGEFEGGEFDAFSIPEVDVSAPRHSAQSVGTSYSGTVEQVWEDGFRLNTGDRSIRVDSWDLYGDRTPQFISVGDQITVTGEFEGGEFDVFSVSN